MSRQFETRWSQRPNDGEPLPLPPADELIQQLEFVWAALQKQLGPDDGSRYRNMVRLDLGEFIRGLLYDGPSCLMPGVVVFFLTRLDLIRRKPNIAESTWRLKRDRQVDPRKVRSMIKHHIVPRQKPHNLIGT